MVYKWKYFHLSEASSDVDPDFATPRSTCGEESRARRCFTSIQSSSPTTLVLFSVATGETLLGNGVGVAGVTGGPERLPRLLRLLLCWVYASWCTSFHQRSISQVVCICTLVIFWWQLFFFGGCVWTLRCLLFAMSCDFNSKELILFSNLSSKIRKVASRQISTALQILFVRRSTTSPFNSSRIIFSRLPSSEIRHQ